MRIIFLPLAAAAMLATVSIASAQTPAPTATPAASAAPQKPHHTKKASPAPAASPVAAASPAPAATASPSPAKKKRMPKSADATPSETPTATVAPGGGNGLVWVNTKSHKYHKEGSRYYGRTKDGKYMSEQDAMAEGDHESTHHKKAADSTPKPQ